MSERIMAGGSHERGRAFETLSVDDRSWCVALLPWADFVGSEDDVQPIDPEAYLGPGLHAAVKLPHSAEMIAHLSGAASVDDLSPELLAFLRSANEFAEDVSRLRARMKAASLLGDGAPGNTAIFAELRERVSAFVNGARLRLRKLIQSTGVDFATVYRHVAFDLASVLPDDAV